jgi:multidrug resistance efflux pump
MEDFAQTFTALRAEHSGAVRIMLLLGALLLAGWFAWALLARVTLYEVSSEARLELEGAAYPIASPLLGRIVAINLHIGDNVRKGDVLVELDSMPQQLQRDETETELRGIDPQLSSLKAQIDAQNGAAEHEAQGLSLSGQEARSRVLEAEGPAHFADLNLDRTRKLYTQHLISTQDLERAESEAARLHAAANALAMAVERMPLERAARHQDREARLAQLAEQRSALEAKAAALRAESARLAYEIEQRRIRAPADGQLGESSTLRVGSVVDEGDRLASIIPEGRLLIIANYPAPAAFGRIRAGQEATLRLEGFPWAEFGTVSGRVERVAREVRDGKVRIELALNRASTFSGHLEHGMPGTLEVAVERVSPGWLLLRAAGQGLTRHL